MKFLCDNCKAKYQIADEKVAGKTVRMKCRKCGHQIEVRAAVTETTSLAPPKPAVAPLAAPPPRPPVPARPLATSLSAAKPKAPSAPAGALAGAFQRNLSDAPDALAPEAHQEGIGSRLRGGDEGPLALSVSDEWYVAINGVPVGPVRISELRRKAAAGAVTEDSLCWQEGLEEWRPIKSIPELATLVREAAQGGARPSMISAPDIPPSVRSNIPPGVSARPPMPSAPSFSSSQAGPVVPAPPSFDATAAMPMPAGALPGGTRPSPPFPQGGPAPLATGRNNVVPIRPAASNERASDDFGLGLGAAATAAAPSLAPQQPIFSQAPATSPLAPPITVPSPIADPFAVPPPPPGVGLGSSPPINAPGYHEGAPPIAPVMAAVPAQQQPPPRSIPLWFWPVLLLALGFGGGLAFVVFRPAPPPAPVVIQVPATQTATTVPSATAPVDKGDIPPPPPAGDPTPAEQTGGKTATTTKPGAKVAAATAAKPATDEKKPGGLDLGGLVPGAGGPNVGPGAAAGGGGGGGLDQAGVERVVAAHRAGVKRTCWERGGADQKSSVNVTINATVAPNGSVATTSSSGDDPVVAKCIENQVKSWQFSAPGASQQIAIPFKFVRQ